MSRFLVGLFIISLFFILPVPRLSQAGTKVRHQSTRTTETCINCHTDLKHGGSNGLFTPDCAVCHSSSSPNQVNQHAESNPLPDFTLPYTITTLPLAQMPLSVSRTKPGSRTENMDEKALVRASSARGTTAGMQGEMYYQTSKRGAQPNPMELVPAGDFIMGTNNRLPDEGPEHSVSLPAYFIDKYEVTNLQYKQFNDATGRKSPTHFRNRTFPEGKADHPVTFVSWDDADAYCRWSGKRLPTDAEWEKAARGTTGFNFPWGDEFDVNKANTPLHWEAIKQQGDTTPVGAFPSGVSPYGIYDMSGNVWEWTDSWYKPYPGNTHASENYGETYKVLKGGSWWDCSFYKCGISAPSYNRSFFLQHTRNKSFGFRCARDSK